VCAVGVGGIGKRFVSCDQLDIDLFVELVSIFFQGGIWVGILGWFGVV